MAGNVLALSTLALATYLATTIQTLVGFGFALIVMPVATMLLGVHTAAPLVALTALTLYIVNVVRYRESLNLAEVWRLAAAAAVGVPVGIWAFTFANVPFLKAVLGLLLIGYAVHGFTHPPSHECSPGWAYLAGFVAGGLGGAFNTPGPPLAVYGGLRQWPRDEFRAGLQTLFVLSASLTVGSHAVANHLTLNILRLYAWTPLALLLGILTGLWVDRYVNKERFRTCVLVMILLLGLSLLLGLHQH